MAGSESAADDVGDCDGKESLKGYNENEHMIHAYIMYVYVYTHITQGHKHAQDRTTVRSKL